MRGTNWEGADLSGSSLFGSFAKGANFRNTNLTGADLESMDFDGADLTGAQLAGAQVPVPMFWNICWVFEYIRRPCGPRSGHHDLPRRMKQFKSLVPRLLHKARPAHRLLHTQLHPCVCPS